MAFKLSNDVHMTTDTTDVSNPYVLDSTSGFRTFGGFLVHNDKTWYTCYDDDTPARFESGVGTYNSATNALTRTTIFQSSEGLGVPIDWPSPGTRSIVCGIPSYVFATESGHAHWGILNPDAPKGFPTKVTAADPDLLPQWEFRSIDSSDVNNIIVDNSTGQGGNVYINTARDLDTLLRKVGGTDAERTMDDPAFFDNEVTFAGIIQLDATSTNLVGLDSSDRHIFRDSGGDELFAIKRVGSQDAELYLYEGGAGVSNKALTSTTITESQIAIYQDFKETLVDASIGDLTLSITVPSGMTDLHINVEFHIQHNRTWDAVSGVARTLIEMSTSAGGGWVTVASFSNITYEIPGGTGWSCTNSPSYIILDATDNTTYEFRATSAGYNFVPRRVAGDGPHTSRLTAFKAKDGWL